MRDYIKPFIEEEEIEIEDVIAVSLGNLSGSGNVDSDGEEKDVSDLWP